MEMVLDFQNYPTLKKQSYATGTETVLCVYDCMYLVDMDYTHEISCRMLRP